MCGEEGCRSHRAICPFHVVVASPTKRGLSGNLPRRRVAGLERPIPWMRSAVILRNDRFEVVSYLSFAFESLLSPTHPQLPFIGHLNTRPLPGLLVDDQMTPIGGQSAEVTCRAYVCLLAISFRVRTVSKVPPSSHSVVMPMNRRCSAQSSGMSRDSSLSGSSPVGAVPCNTAF